MSCMYHDNLPAVFSFPCHIVQGALFGSILGMSIALWIGLGAVLYGPSAIDDNLPVGQCPWSNSTEMANSTVSVYNITTTPVIMENKEEEM